MGSVVIQDCDEILLEILTIALDMEEITAYKTTDYDTKVLELIEQVKPDLVMLDYRLDGKECIQLFNQIRKIYPYLPVIAVSCNLQIDLLYRIYDFTDYLEKPFELDKFYKIIWKYINKAKLSG
jgi:DNA-binding NtrC family response regulator